MELDLINNENFVRYQVTLQLTESLAIPNEPNYRICLEILDSVPFDINKSMAWLRQLF